MRSGYDSESKNLANECLNPYSNGTLSDDYLEILSDGDDRLNPYSNGRCSRRYKYSFCTHKHNAVLILILMEDALGVHVGRDGQLV